MENVNPVFVKPDVFFGPFIKANKVSVANVEKLVNFYQGILPGYIELGLGQLKAAAQVSDIESAQAFAKSQVEAVKTFNEKVTADSKALGDLMSGFVAEYNGLVQESAQEFAPKAVKKAA